MFVVVKYHVTEGATSSLVKCETEAEALKQYHQLAANYMADTSVKEWSLAIIEPVEMKPIKREHYIRTAE